eukprot:11208279-Lingulodinium_polyedra.AAC.1
MSGNHGRLGKTRGSKIPIEVLEEAHATTTDLPTALVPGNLQEGPADALNHTGINPGPKALQH